MTSRPNDPTGPTEPNGDSVHAEPTDPADAIAAALARLRGRRPGGPPWGSRGPHGQRGPRGDHGSHGVLDDGDGHSHDGRSHGEHHGDGRGHGDQDGTHGWPHRGHGGPPWGDDRGFGTPGAGQGGRGGGGRGAERFGGPARLRMLDALASATEPLSVSEIAETIGVDQPRGSRLVQQSVKLGLVRREADQDDARRTRVALTDEGRALVRGVRGERRATIDAALDGFTKAERDELARLLTKLADAWPAQ